MKPYWFIIGFVVVLWLVLGKNPMDLFKNSILNVVLCVFGLSDLFGTKMPVGAWWYMCFAQIVLLSIPFLAKLCKKYGWLVLLASFILLQYLGAEIQSSYGGRYTNYLFVVVLGVICATEGTMEKLGKKSKYKILHFVDALAILAAIVCCIRINMKYSSIDEWRFTKMFMAFAAMLICLLVFKYFTHPILERVLIFFGKHSGNMFLLHAFGYIFYPKYIYWSHNVMLTYITLFSVSLIASILCQLLYGFGTKAWKKVTVKAVKS